MIRVYRAKVINARVTIYGSSILGLGLGLGLGSSKLWLDLGLWFMVFTAKIRVRLLI